MTNATVSTPTVSTPVRDQRVTLILKSGERVEFTCASFSTVKNGFKETMGFQWDGADRFVWVDFAEVAAATVETTVP